MADLGEAPQRSYSFGAGARRSLQKLGLIDEQIAELETILPFCRLDIEAAARLADVRAALRSTHKAADGALDAMRRLSEASSSSLREALNRAQMASNNAGGDCREIDRAQDALAALSGVLSKALADLPKKQRRSNAASPRPIDRIRDALLKGWARGGAGRAFNLAPELEYRNSAARTTRSSRAEADRKFDAVVCVCYETIGKRRDYEAERPLRRFRRTRGPLKK